MIIRNRILFFNGPNGINMVKILFIFLITLPITLVAQQPKSSLKKRTSTKKKKTSFPHAHETAHITIGNELCSQEETFRARRKKYAQSVLNIWLNTDIPEEAVPVIAIAGSGGGFRAMVATNGSMAGAASWELWKCISYLAGVSGSTWAIAGFMQSPGTPQAYLKQLAQRLTKPFDQDANQAEVEAVINRKKKYNLPADGIDTYGELIAHKLLKGLQKTKKPSDYYLDSCSPEVHKGILPLPLYTSTMLTPEQTYAWIEYTPYTTYAVALNASIPTWAFGRKFDNGTSTNNPPPQTLGFGMGLWGSAMTASLNEMIKSFKKHFSSEVENLVDMFLESPFGALLQPIRLIPPCKIYNWTYGSKQPYHDQEMLSLTDPGVDLGVPLPPLLRQQRNVDIIIILENGQTPHDGSTLRACEKYARDHNLLFPPINYEKVGDLCSVHQDQTNTSCPTIIYLPLVKNKDYLDGWDPNPLLPDAFTSTANFIYTPEQVQKLSGLTEYAISCAATKKIITQAIISKINQKVPGIVK